MAEVHIYVQGGYDTLDISSNKRCPSYAYMFTSSDFTVNLVICS